MEALHLDALLHVLTQALKYPTILLLLLLVAFAVVTVAMAIVEYAVERRHFKVALPELIAKVNDAEYKDLPAAIEESGLLRGQKNMLLTMVAYGYLPEEARVALAKRMLSQEEQRYLRVTSRTDLVAKIAPMLGLMGTLIPLGPGVVAMGQGQVDLLSSSIEIAFDTTIAGLVVAIIAMFISRLRKSWYEDYLEAEEAAMSSILEKAGACIAAGENIGNAQAAEQTVNALPGAKDKRADTGKDASAQKKDERHGL